MITTTSALRIKLDQDVYNNPKLENTTITIDGVEMTFDKGRYFLFETSIQNEFNRRTDDKLQVAEVEGGLVITTIKEEAEVKEIETTETAAPEVIKFEVGKTYFGESHSTGIQHTVKCVSRTEGSLVTFSYDFGKGMVHTNYSHIKVVDGVEQTLYRTGAFCLIFGLSANQIVVDEIETERISIHNEIVTLWLENRKERLEGLKRETEQLRAERAAKVAKEAAPVTKPKRTKKVPTFPNKKLLNPEYREQEFKNIVHLFESCGVKVSDVTNQNITDMHYWKLTDKDKNKGSLYLTSGSGWELGVPVYGYELKGFFEGLDFPEFLEMNGVTTIETED